MTISRREHHPDCAKERARSGDPDLCTCGAASALRPLPEGELNAIADRAEHGVWLVATRDDVQRLVAEVRRLRSDEWLRAAALEIADKYESGTASRLASAVMILRKHRDGKA